MSQALYRKHRPKKLEDIVGQPHITTTLQNTLKSGKTSHAYLFTGPRGVGKTSIARILAHELNKLPYEEDSTHLDIIEIDAASNRRIDEIRELRERVHTAPTSAKYKVYIIDEVHMLTKEAFNALLKTLEEPPAHAVFILATTEAHKLPDTIVSRTQRYTFKPVEREQAIAHLQHIAKQEGLTVHTDALALIAEHGGGSFRDSISILDQVRGHADEITLQDVEHMLGVAPETIITQLISVISSGSPAELIEVINEIKDRGYHAGQIAKQLSAHLRAQLLAGKAALSASELTELLEKLLTIPSSQDPMAQLELTLLGVILSRGNIPTTTDADPDHKEKAVSAPQTVTSDKIEAPEPTPAPVESTKKPEKLAATSSKTTAKNSTVSLEAWDEALALLKKTHNTLYSVARMATPHLENDELTLTFGFAFHQKRLNETKNRQIISDIVQKVAGRPVTITCVVSENAHVPEKSLAVEPPVAASTSDTISTISNIFGGAELLES